MNIKSFALFVGVFLLIAAFFYGVMWWPDRDLSAPAGDVARAIQAKDLRFKAVLGFGADGVGVSEGAGNPLVRKHGYTVIKGTSDLIRGAAEARRNHKAWNYAQTYNQLLLNHLQQTPKAKPAKSAKEVTLPWRFPLA